MTFLFGFLALYSFFPAYRTVALALWPLVFLWMWLQWFCQARLNISFTWDFLRFIPHAHVFSDSIRYLKVAKAAIFSAPFFAFSFCLVQPIPSVWTPLFIAAVLAQIGNRKKKTKEPEYVWKFPTEVARPIEPGYPLLRKTYGFIGKKRFQAAAQKPHVIFLFLESFRAKNVGCLGGTPAASPQFDALSQQGVLFSRFHANGLQTFRAMISSFFGIPAHLNTMSLQSFCHIPFIGLPEILKDHGYHTALIQASYTAFDWTFPFFRKHSFDTILGREHFHTGPKTSWGISDEALLHFAADWLEKQTAPTFLSLFTITNHHPWESPIPFPTPEGLPVAYRRFLQTFSYTDHCLGLFIERLKQTGLLDKSIVFIMGDHGQEMGERSPQIAIHNDLYQENIHIPLLLLCGESLRIDEPASQVDLLPTVLDLLNIPAVHHSVGRSLAREGNAPLFFSMPRKTSKIGCIQENTKLILGEEEECYQLPDEQKRCEVPPALKQMTRSYFQSIETLYAQSAWAPPSLEKIPFEMKASPNMTDAEWATFIDQKPRSPIFDLSHTALTDRAVEAIGTQGVHIHELNLSHSTRFTDRALAWVAAHCPHLSIFNAAQCLLITDQGASAILNRCPYLRYFNLEGNSDITDFSLERETFLNALHLKECSNIRGEALARIARFCPHLDYFVASLEKAEDLHLAEIANHLDQLLYLWLENGTSITDPALNVLIAANPRLSILIIENFAQIASLDLSGKKWLNTLKFAHCPNLTNATLESLEGLQLERLSLVDCPKITPNGLAKIHPKCQITVDT